MKKLLSVILAIAMMMTVIPFSAFSAEDTSSVFTDVDGDEYYAQAAEALAALGILKGYEEDDGFSFGAEKAITRAEMTAIVCRVLDKDAEASNLKGETDFDDVSEKHWASGYINYASQNGIVNGYGNGKFMPEANVKFEEAIKMLVCAFGYGEGITSSGNNWAAPYLEAAEEHGFTANLEGEKGENATRGDVAVMVFNGETEDVAAPVVSVEAGKYTSAQYVKLSTETENAEIHYTLDGSEPTAASKKYESGTAISISQTGTLKAVTVKKGVYFSEVVVAEYTIEKKSSGGGGGGGGGGGTSKYTVSFNLNYSGAEGAPAKQTVKKGECATVPEAPAREGYVFLGWSTKKADGEIFDFATEIKKTTKLYAVWEANENSVVFKLNYGEIEEVYESVTVYSGEVITEPAVPEREGFDFLGWFIEPECANKFDFTYGTVVADTVLYAGWKEKTLMSIVLTASETEFFTADGSKAVCFYATIVENDNTITSITLYDVDGNPISSMYDDGMYSENGDELSNDDIYSCKVNIDLEEAEMFVYRVVALASTTVSSNALEITVYDSITEEQLENIEEVDVHIANEIFASEEFDSMNADERKTLAEEELQKLEEQELIVENSAIYDEESNTISFIYESGVLGAIALYDWNELQNGSNSYERTQEPYTSTVEVTYDEMNDNSAVLFSDVVDIDADAVILWSFNQAWDTETYRKPFYKTIEQDWENKGVDTTVVWDTTVDDYKNLEEYEIIVFSGHGSYYIYCINGEEKSLPSLILREKSGKKNDEKYKNDLKLWNIGKISVKGGTMYTILPNFWGTYYDAGDLDGSFVYGENCEFFGRYGDVNYAMADAILNTSAEAVVGFHNSVMADYSRNLMKLYIDSLIAGETAGEAFETAKETYGVNDYFYGREAYGPTAYPIFVGEEDALLVSNTLKNGSFENDVPLESWKRSGDTRVIKKLGGLLATHKDSMAILTTGIGSGTSGYLEATEGSVIYQSFLIPEEQYVLSFDYNVVSEEPHEFVGSKYDDKFYVEIVDKNGEKKIVAEESVNKSDWKSIQNINFDGGDSTCYETGWKSVSVDLSEFKNEIVTLRFVVYDVGDSIYDTAALVDDVKLS